MTSIGYACCVGSWERFSRYVLPHAQADGADGPRPVLGISGQDSIAAAYNLALDWGVRQNLDMLVLQHDDLEILDGTTSEDVFASALSEDGVELVGIAGGSARGGLAWWNHDPIGAQQTDAMMISHATRTGDVDLLEGSLLVFSRWAMDKLRFELWPGFHGYDEIAYRLRARWNRRAVVVDVATHHHTQLGFDDDASWQAWLAADAWFRKKWGI